MTRFARMASTTMHLGCTDNRSSRTITAISVGGPVLFPEGIQREKQEFFCSVILEKTKVKNSARPVSRDLPTTDFKRGNFSRLFNAGFTGNTRSGTTVAALTSWEGRPVQFGADLRSGLGADGEREHYGSAISSPEISSSASGFERGIAKILELAPIDDPLFNTMLNNIPALGSAVVRIFKRADADVQRRDHNYQHQPSISGTGQSELPKAK